MNDSTAHGTHRGIKTGTRSFSELLGNSIDAHGLTVKEAAAIVCRVPRMSPEIIRQAIHRWLSGKRVPNLERQRQVLEALADPITWPEAEMRAWMEKVHGLTWDASKKRWVLRVTIDVGKNVVGRRITVRLKTSDPRIAIAKREAIMEAFRVIGIHVNSRVIARR